MTPSFKQLYIHLIFAINGRKNLIPPKHFEELQQCLTGIIQEKLGSKLIYVKAQKDHTHLFIGWECKQSLSELVSKTKTTSTGFIKRKPWGLHNFAWQNGYGAFSYSNYQIDSFVKYLKRQETYHQTHTFREEYINILEKFEVTYEDRYLFEFYEDIDSPTPLKVTPSSTKKYRPHTFTKLLLHLVLVVKGREVLIPKAHKTMVQQCLAQVLEKNGHRLLEIHCMPDHTHILVEFHAAKKLDVLVDTLQSESQVFIQAQSWMSFVFEWQESFGVFSCSPSHAKVTAKYIRNQEEHHRNTTFQEEFRALLKEEGLDFSDKIWLQT